MSEKTKQSFLNFTCKEMVWSVNFWSRDWKGRKPWMKSFRKVEGDGRMVRRQTQEKESSVSITETSALTAHTAQQHCSEFHQGRSLEFLCSFKKIVFVFEVNLLFAQHSRHRKRSSMCAGGGWLSQ